ncbi:hypothetical protein [Paraburkholderia azotifigens]|uniref:Uncharacterized protein n=1 Tax=Paraburkholderia azotifigens TaxID=2057004 RepID=A0A5C6VUQ8_9BURK|nr:hypothetical protein [Paraburkholderia azotifigens]TXC88927.1 hypothetical protein FRZ40_15940 [Paraburkholderia azotifigens]
MEKQISTSYRGYTIDLLVKPSESDWTEGRLRYAASWVIFPPDVLVRPIESLTAQSRFLTRDAALTYAEQTARKFIDDCFAAGRGE